MRRSFIYRLASTSVRIVRLNSRFITVGRDQRCLSQTVFAHIPDLSGIKDFRTAAERQLHPFDELVMERLKKVDEVSYVRFASVYR